MYRQSAPKTKTQHVMTVVCSQKARLKKHALAERDGRGIKFSSSRKSWRKRTLRLTPAYFTVATWREKRGRNDTMKGGSGYRVLGEKERHIFALSESSTCKIKIHEKLEQQRRHDERTLHATREVAGHDHTHIKGTSRLLMFDARTPALEYVVYTLTPPAAGTALFTLGTPARAKPISESQGSPSLWRELDRFKLITRVVPGLTEHVHSLHLQAV